MTTQPADYYAEQAAADEWLAGDDWPDSDTRRYMRRRRQWMPIDDLPDIGHYTPAA